MNKSQLTTTLPVTTTPTPAPIRLTLPELRRLADLTTRAAAALVPLAADGRGMDSHHGALPDPAGTLARALDGLVDAGALASHLRVRTWQTSKEEGK